MQKQPLTAKELSAIQDELSAEQLLVKKYQMYAHMACDPSLQQACRDMAAKHQRHFDTLLTYLQ